MEARTRTATPAWPTLVGVHLVALAAIVGSGWRVAVRPVAPAPPLERRIAEMNVPGAEQALDRALAREQPQGALMEQDEVAARSFLSLAAQSGGLVAEVRSMEPGPGAGGLLAVDAVIDLVGDAFDLPIMVAALQGQAAIARPARLDVAVAPGGAAHAALVVRYARPDPGDTSWIGRRLSVAAPGADRAAPALEKGARLAAAQAFGAARPELERAAREAREALLRALPEALLRVRMQGGHVTWDAADGIEVRGR